MVKVMSGNIEPATLRRKTFSGHGLELVVSNRTLTHTIGQILYVGGKYYVLLRKAGFLSVFCRIIMVTGSSQSSSRWPLSVSTATTPSLYWRREKSA